MKLTTPSAAPIVRLTLPFLFALPLLAGPVSAQERVPTLQEANAHLQAQELPEAVAALDAICAAQPENGQAWFLYGYTVHMQGDYARAIPLHAKAATFQPQRPTALYNLACAQSRAGDQAKALEALAGSIDSGFAQVALIASDPDLAALRATPAFAAFEKARAGATDTLAPAPLVLRREERQLDFLIGEWDVSWDGQPARTSSIEFTMNGQSIIEESADFTAFYTWIAKEGVWRETWMSSNGHHDVLEGKREGDHIVLRQDLLRDRPGVVGRSRYIDVQPDSFQVHWETSTDSGATWNLEFRGQYTRRAPLDRGATCTPAGFAAGAPQECQQYAFKLGHWDITCRALQPDGTLREGTGTSFVHVAADGLTLEDDIRARFAWGGQGFDGQTRRVWDTENAVWRCSWNPKTGAANAFVGQWNDEQQRMLETFRGQDARGAFTGVLGFYDVTEDGYHARLDHHYDGGPVVKGVWEYVATRMP